MSTREALQLHDALDTADLAFMLGAWSGDEFPTGHPLDGALTAYGWQGKRFDSAEEVHPLVFRSWGGRRVSLNPAWVAPGMPLVMRWPLLKRPPAAQLARLLLPLLATRRSRARLRMVTHRGRTTATMVYDDVPIQDVFRKVDEDTVLGLMDRKGMAQPLFFLLRRERN